MAGYPEVILPIWLGGWLRFRKAVQKSLLGDVVTSCRAVLPQMIERLSGKIIVLSGRRKADTTGAVSGIRAVELHERETDSCDR
jgi:hypothetical protein